MKIFYLLNDYSEEKKHPQVSWENDFTNLFTYFL